MLPYIIMDLPIFVGQSEFNENSPEIAQKGM